MSKHNSEVVWLSAAVLGLVLAGCGKGEVTGSAVTGVALTDGPISGTVALTDSSAQMQSRSVSTRADGSFSIDVADLTPPYMLRVEWTDAAGDKRLFAVAEGNDNIDVNGITDLAFSSAASESGDDEDDVFEHSGSEEKRDAASRARALLARLSTVLAPLFQRYGITDPRIDKEAVRVLLEDVRVRRDDGIVKVTNRATGGVIFSGPLSNLESGTFHPENMPAGPGTPPPAVTCTAFTYSAYGACQPSNTQTRTVLTSAPAGCTGGSPVTSQGCTYVPPTNTCTSFTYSPYGACQPNNTQTRTVLTSAPAGCTGGSPITSQGCTYVPPIDGSALYAQYCAGCHGNSKKGKSASATQNAINSNRGGMGTAELRALTPAQIAAIAAAP